MGAVCLVPASTLLDPSAFNGAQPHAWGITALPTAVGIGTVWGVSAIRLL